MIAIARNVKFSFLRGGGSSLEILFGKVSLTPSNLHTLSTTAVLPAPTTFDLVNGVAIATNVAPTPAPIEGKIAWAYVVKITSSRGQVFEYMVGVPDGTTEINFNVLPRYYETKPEAFGTGPQGPAGTSATVAVGVVDSGTVPAVTNTGTSTNAVLNFTLAKGDKGDTGTGIGLISHQFTDAPSVYPTGVTLGNTGNSANGWPAPLLTIATHKQNTVRAKQVLTNVANTIHKIRTQGAGDFWGEFRDVAYGDLASPLLNGLMPAMDKAKLDGMTPAANTKTFAALASTYQAGFSTVQVRVADGWPVVTTGTVVTQKTATGNASVAQWLYAVEGGVPLYRVTNVAGNWLPFQTIATDASVASFGQVIPASYYGVVGNGVVDDTAAFVAAMSDTATQGKTLSLKRGSTLALVGNLTVPAGATIQGNDAVLSWAVPTGNWLLSMGGANINMQDVLLKVDNTTGQNQRGISVYQSNRVTLSNVRVEALLPGAGFDSRYKNGVYVAQSNNVTLEDVTVVNFDYSFSTATTSNLTLIRCVANTYRTGYYLTDTKAATLTDCLAQGSSPNSGPLAGHNGVLIDSMEHYGTTDLTLTNVIVRDSGEHGFRVGGDKVTSRVHFNNCKAINSGRSGFKVLGGTIEAANYHEYISFTDCLSEDAGNVEINSAGFMIQFVKYATLTNPKVVRRNKTYSAGIGIEFQAIDGMSIINPYIESTIVAGIKMGAVLGNVSEINIDGGYVFANSGDCLWVDYGSVTLRRLRMNGYPELNIGGSGYAVKITSSTGTVTGRSVISFYSVSATTSLIHPDSSTAGMMLDARAPFPSTLSNSLFANGSVWWDTQTTAAEPRYKVGGAWKKATYV